MTLVLSGLLEDQHHQKVVWKYATTMFGELSVTTFGVMMTPLLFVGSWDSPVKV